MTKETYPIEKIRDIGIIAHIDASPFASASGSLKPSGFNISATGKLPFSRPLSRINVRVWNCLRLYA